LKTCSRCSIFTLDSEAVCPKCGRLLSYGGGDDPQTLAAIKQLRAGQRTRPPEPPLPAGPHYARWALAIFVVSLGLMFAAIHLSTVSDTPSSSADQWTPPVGSSATATPDTKTRIPCLCAIDYASVAPVLQAYRNSDTAAMYGLTSRGKAIQLAEGTKVFVAGRESGVATVLIESGVHSGQTCHLWGKFLE
jgi:hypothetical protein